jgi:argininosuccinate lyase
MKIWKGDSGMNKKIESFTIGEDFLLDQNLVKYDVLTSIAHSKMLSKIGILTENEFKKLKKVLLEILKMSNKNEFKIRAEEEDVHTAIENYLTIKLGDLGKKIHTGRSRNDQILTDIRLYSKEKLFEVEEKLLSLCQILLDFSKKFESVPIPGYTHMRKAMLSSIGLWSSSFIESLLDDLVLMKTALDLNDQCPLGSGASYGIPLEIDREFTSKILGFKKVQNNVLYANNSRGKIEASTLYALTQIMLTLNKLATDLLLFTMPEFEFFTFPENFFTGSSIMPQKRNPDFIELVRAKSSVMESYLFQVNNLIKNLPSGYNRDFQLTKKPLMEAFELTLSTLDVCILVMKGLNVNKENCIKMCTPEIFATDFAYDLVKKGIPFREAYRETARELNNLGEVDHTEALKKRNHLGGLNKLNLDNLRKEISKELEQLEMKRLEFQKNLEILKKDSASKQEKV